MSVCDIPLRQCTTEQVEQLRQELKEWKPDPSEVLELRQWWEEACQPPVFPAAFDVCESLFKHLGWDAHRMLLAQMSPDRVWQHMGDYGKHHDLGTFWLAHAIKDGEHELARQLATGMAKRDEERANLVIGVDRRIKIWGHVRLSDNTIKVLDDCLPHLIWSMTNWTINTINDACVSIEQIRSNPNQSMTSGSRLLQDAKAHAFNKILNPAAFFSAATQAGFAEEYLFAEMDHADQRIAVWLDRMPAPLQEAFHKTMSSLLGDESLAPLVQQGAPMAVSLHQQHVLDAAVDPSSNPSSQAKKL